MENGKKRVLVIVDMQNDFISGSLGSEYAKKIVPNVIKKIKEGDWDKILLTMDTHFENYLNTKEGQKLPIKHCVVHTKGWELNEDIVNAVKEKMNNNVYMYEIIRKKTFGSTILPSKIPSNTDEIEICGLCTEICVVSNALMLKAHFYEGTDITIDSSCCAGVTPEKHEAALEVMKSCQINVI